MKRTKKAISCALMATLTCVLLTGQAFAAEDDAVWVDLQDASDKVSAVIESNAVVSDGVLSVTFDAEKLTYAGCDFVGENEEYAPYVAVYSVNDEKAGEGVLQIAWVAPEAYEISGSSESLFQVNFAVNEAYEGTVKDGDVAVSGSANSPEGAAVEVGEEPTEPAPETTPAPGGDSSSSSTGSSSSSSSSSTTTVTVTGGTTSTGAGQPATGDSSTAAVCAAVMAVCVAGAGGITVWNKRRAAK